MLVDWRFREAGVPSNAFTHSIVFLPNAHTYKHSTYLVQKRLDMLPKLLTETLCSLTDKEPHFAFRCVGEGREGKEGLVFGCLLPTYLLAWTGRGARTCWKTCAASR